MKWSNGITGSVHKSQAILSETDCPHSHLLFISLCLLIFLPKSIGLDDYLSIEAPTDEQLQSIGRMDGRSPQIILFFFYIPQQPNPKILVLVLVRNNHQIIIV